MRVLWKKKGRRSDGTDICALDAPRKTPPYSLAGSPVTAVVDYAHGQNGLPPADMLEFRLVKGRVLLRPSGTEPKFKLYLEYHAQTKKEAQQGYAALQACRTIMENSCQAE